MNLLCDLSPSILEETIIIVEYFLRFQVGRDASIHIWDVESLETVSVLQGFHERGVTSVDFSGTYSSLASSDVQSGYSAL